MDRGGKGTVIPPPLLHLPSPLQTHLGGPSHANQRREKEKGMGGEGSEGGGTYVFTLLLSSQFYSERWNEGGKK